MTVQELINELELIEDKSKPVKVFGLDRHLEDVVVEDCDDDVLLTEE